MIAMSEKNKQMSTAGVSDNLQFCQNQSKFHFQSVLKAAQKLQTIKTFLALELSQYSKIGNTFS